ncbi:MAG: hypothetical protein ACREEA_11185, partial [Stellaceae bacterium]
MLAIGRAFRVPRNVAEEKRGEECMRLFTQILAPAFVFALIFAAPAYAANTDDIPVIASLTGGGAFLGQEEQQAIQILEKLVNQTGGIHG